MIRLLTILSAILVSQQVQANISNTIKEDKVIHITVNQYSQVLIGRDTLTISDLSKELEERLWRNFLGTGKTYDAIKLSFTETVSQTTKEAVIAAIKNAQKAVLKSISLEKHEDIYESLPPDKQQKLKKQFPALFQQF